MEKNNLSRRDFVKIAGMGGAASLVAPFALGDSADKANIGSTFILWGYNADSLEPALRDMSKLGFYAFETFGQVIEKYETERGGLKDMMDKYNIPIISAFCMTDVLNPSKRKDEVKKLVRWAQLLKKNGGKLVEYCAASIDRRGYNYKEHKKDLVESMNEYAKAVTDQGLVCSLHPHTGTPIETQEEVYFIMEHLDTNYMKFGPDVGQLEKGGADPVKIVKDFMPLIEHVHLKDYAGHDENRYLGYAPLGEGKVRIRKILRMLEERKGKMHGMIMFELDSNRKAEKPVSEYEAAKISHDYLEKLGYKFRN